MTPPGRQFECRGLTQDDGIGDAGRRTRPPRTNQVIRNCPREFSPGCLASKWYDSSMNKHFTVDARAVLTWGRDSIKDHTTAVLELVKNSYDAGSTVVVVTINAGDSDPEKRFLRISDAGEGMSGANVENHWLRIGFSEKLQARQTRTGRRKTGEKGIGRISADREIWSNPVDGVMIRRPLL